MEFVVLSGNKKSNGEPLAHKLRAHGFRYYSTDLYFMDDFGEFHIDRQKTAVAEQWCRHHAEVEFNHHRDVVVEGVTFEPAFLLKAQTMGYSVTLLDLKHEQYNECEKRVDRLIANHDSDHPTLMHLFAQRIFKTKD